MNGVTEFRADVGRPMSEPQFDRLVEDIRAELAGYRGDTDEERESFTEALNRAVLGYEEERKRFFALIGDRIARRRIRDSPPERTGFSTLAEAVFAEVIGLNVLENVLKYKKDLEEIQVVGTRVFEVRGGFPRPSSVSFRRIRDVERIQQNLVLFNRDSIHLRKRWAEVMLQDGARVTMTGFGFTSEPTLTIRFYTAGAARLEQLAQPPYDTLDDGMLRLLRTLLKSRVNFVIAGATNSGKTQLMKAMLAELPDEERIVTIEARHELNLKRDFPAKNVIEYAVDEDDPLHDGRRAFKLALRQSPQRICHAEIRDGDANLYVRACTRGHDGSMTTVHVSCLEDVPDAVADMCLQDGRPVDARRLAVRIARYVTQVGIETAVVGVARKIVRIGQFEVSRDGDIRVHDLVRWDSRGRKWHRTGGLRGAPAARAEMFDPEGYAELVAEGWIEPCTG